MLVAKYMKISSRTGTQPFSLTYPVHFRERFLASDSPTAEGQGNNQKIYLQGISTPAGVFRSTRDSESRALRSPPGLVQP